MLRGSGSNSTVGSEREKVGNDWGVRGGRTSYTAARDGLVLLVVVVVVVLVWPQTPDWPGQRTKVELLGVSGSQPEATTFLRPASHQSAMGSLRGKRQAQVATWTAAANQQGDPFCWVIGRPKLVLFVLQRATRGGAQFAAAERRRFRKQGGAEEAGPGQRGGARAAWRIQEQRRGWGDKDDSSRADEPGLEGIVANLGRRHVVEACLVAGVYCASVVEEPQEDQGEEQQEEQGEQQQGEQQGEQQREQQGERREQEANGFGCKAGRDKMERHAARLSAPSKVQADDEYDDDDDFFFAPIEQPVCEMP
ncbi:hypothetical protein K505DRAFT_335045 [Melanomma pulvis-pyrius CBS 109.77]|uniref:Uncharacterized protein n=1 Tax=Melanomma pulvis-pyrius CBS 109.77 TaxID=1314802 RepID=A0A6A6XKI2_9PLEO|nr:hypothetical protein K505DRAFT_335045 [Melanomma pulvis-pyrius CBS 109.77]